MKYSTGRTYNGPQVLDITVIPQEDADEFGFYDARIEFKDESRGICGWFLAVSFKRDPERAIGRMALAEYDGGRYTLM